MTTLTIDLNKVKNQENWTVTKICRDLVAENSDVDRIEVVRGDKPAYTVLDVKHMATLEPRSEGGFRKYRQRRAQPRTEEKI